MTKDKDDDDATVDEAREGQQVVFRLPVPLYRKVRQTADDEYLMLSEYLRKVLREAIEATECEECGADHIPGDALYCPQCGEEFEEEDEEEEVTKD